MNAILVFIALFTLMMAGVGLSIPVFKNAKTISPVGLMAISWLLGCAFVSMALPCMGLIASGLFLQMLVTAGCILLGGFGLRSLYAVRSKLTSPRPATFVEWLLCGALFTEFVVSLCLEANESLGWDGMLVWEIKARYAFLNGGTLPLAYFADGTRVWSHPEYPLFIPMVEEWLYLWVGNCDQFCVRIIFPVFYCVAGFLLYSGVSSLSGKRWPGLLAAVMLFFIPYPLVGSWNLLAGYVDFPLGLFYLAALIYYWKYLRTREPAHLILFSVLAGILPWVKREGVVLWVCLMGIAACGLLRQKNRMAALSILLPGLVTAGGWKIATAILKAPANTDFAPFSLQTLVGNIGRVGPILNELRLQISNLGDWSLLWFALPVALGCLAFRGHGRLSMMLTAAILLPIGFYCGIYLLSSWPSYVAHIHVSLPRLLLQIAPLALYAVSLAVGLDQRRRI